MIQCLQKNFDKKRTKKQIHFNSNREIYLNINREFPKADFSSLIIIFFWSHELKKIRFELNSSTDHTIGSSVTLCQRRHSKTVK